MFLVLRGFSCSGFSIQQETLSRKWACKRCGAKQSIQRVYFKSESSRAVREALTRIAVQIATLDAAAVAAKALELDGVRARGAEADAGGGLVAQAGAVVEEITAASSRLEAAQARALGLRETANVNTGAALLAITASIAGVKRARDEGEECATERAPDTGVAFGNSAAGGEGAGVAQSARAPEIVEDVWGEFV